MPRRFGYILHVCVFVHLVGVGAGVAKGRESARGDRTPGRFVRALMLTTPKPQQLTVQTISLIVADRSDAVAARRDTVGISPLPRAGVRESRQSGPDFTA